MTPASAQLRARPERKDGSHPALCNAPPQWLRMRHQRHQSHKGHARLEFAEGLDMGTGSIYLEYWISRFWIV